MAATTTLRVPDELKRRIAEIAQRAGKSPHTVMLEAIAEKAAVEEARQDFEAQAGERMDKFATTGNSLSWSEMRDYLRARAQGKSAVKPQVKGFRD